MSWFNDEVAVEAQEVYASKSFDNSGEHVVQLKYCYILDSNSSQAKAFVVEFEYENGFKGTEKFWFINKNTGTQKTPEGKPTFGSLQVANLFGALKASPEKFKPTPTKIKVFGEEKEMPVFRDLFDKQIRIVVQMKEDEDSRDGSIIEVPEVIGWFDVATRKNAKELKEDTEAKQIESDLKRCTKLRKLKAKSEPKQPESSFNDDGNPWA